LPELCNLTPVKNCNFIPVLTPTRRFHEKQGYILEAVLKDYYDDEDDKCIYVKDI